MDDATKKMMLTIVTGLAKKAAIVISATLATHGVAVTGNATEYIASGIVLLVTLGYGVWTDYLKAIVFSQLEVLKAKSLAQAAKLQQHDIAPVTVEQIAAKGPETMTPASVVKVTATLALAALIVMVALAGPAMAQRADDMARTPGARAAVKLPIDPLGLNNRMGTGSPLNDLLGALDAKLLPDLQYALKLAQASGSKVTAPCYSAWIDIINTRTKAVQDDATPPQAIPLPDPHLVTDFEKLVELRNSLQPESPFMIACSPVASMVKKDILGFIGTVIGGGAGLATLVPGL